MKQKKGSLWLAAILFILPVLFIPLAGCGKAVEETEETAVAEQKDNEYTYTAEFQKLVVDGHMVETAVLGKDEMVYFAAKKEGMSGLFALKIGENTPERLPAEFEKNQQVVAMGTDTEGNLVLGLIKYKDTDQGAEENGEQQDTSMEESASQAEHIEVRTLSVDGSMLHSADVTNAFINKKDLFIQNILADEKGNYYVCANQQMYVIDPSGKALYEASADAYISSLFQVKDGRVIAGYSENNNWRLKEINIERKALTDIESRIPFEYGIYKSGTGTDLIYTQGTILYTYNLEDEKPVEILKWVNNEVDSSKLTAFRILEDGRVVALSRDWSASDFNPELIILTQKSGDEGDEKKEEKIILTFGTTYMPPYMNEDIVSFNKQSDKYRVEVKKYGDETMDIDDRLALMSADISSGKGPDMLDMVSSFTLEEYLNMGVLEDLNPYLEKDEVLNREDFLENIMEFYEREGKLYAITPFFVLNTIIGKVSDVGPGNSWTIDDMIKLVESKPSDIEILPDATKASMLNIMCTMSLDELVNEETGECNFTGDEFKKILEFANYFPKEANYDPDQPSEIEKIRSGKLLLLRSSSEGFVTAYQLYEYMFGEEINFIGYPTLNGSGSIISPDGTTAGMNINSENKEGVWEFIRFLLTKGKQGNPSWYNGLPILKEALEVQFAKDMAKDSYVDINGETKKKQQLVSSYSSYGDSVTVELKEATQEQVDRMREIINSAQRPKGTGSSKMLEIIQEEAQAYFEGTKSVEDTAAVIQNRAQLYINEKR